MGRRGDAGPRALPGPPDRGAAAPSGADLPRRVGSGDHPLSAVLGEDTVSSPDARRAAIGAAEPVRGRRAGWMGRDSTRSCAPSDWGESVLRQSDSRAAGGRRCRRACGMPCLPGSPAGRRRPGTALSCCHARRNRSAGNCYALGCVDDDCRGCSPAPGCRARRTQGVAFRHEIARSAVLEAASPGSEPGLHAAMIEALEAIDGDPACSLTTPRPPEMSPESCAMRRPQRRRPRDPGAHREAVAFLESHSRQVGEDPSTRPVCSRASPTELYLTDRLQDAIAARERARRLRRDARRPSRGWRGPHRDLGFRLVCSGSSIRRTP